MADAVLLKKGAYIVILHADKIPPHIGWLYEGEYYSLKVNGKDFGLPFGKLFDIVAKKNIKTLFVKVEDNNNFLNTKPTFNQTNLEHPTDTCLKPIKKLFVSFLNCQTVQKVADLLLILEQKSQIQKVYSFGINEQSFELPTYGSDEILARITLLQNK